MNLLKQQKDSNTIIAKINAQFGRYQEDKTVIEKKNTQGNDTMSDLSEEEIILEKNLRDNIMESIAFLFLCGFNLDSIVELERKYHDMPLTNTIEDVRCTKAIFKYNDPKFQVKYIHILFNDDVILVMCYDAMEIELIGFTIADRKTDYFYGATTYKIKKRIEFNPFFSRIRDAVMRENNKRFYDNMRAYDEKIDNRMKAVYGEGYEEYRNENLISQGEKKFIEKFRTQSVLMNRILLSRNQKDNIKESIKISTPRLQHSTMEMNFYRPDNLNPRSYQQLLLNNWKSFGYAEHGDGDIEVMICFQDNEKSSEDFVCLIYFDKRRGKQKEYIFLPEKMLNKISEFIGPENEKPLRIIDVEEEQLQVIKYIGIDYLTAIFSHKLKTKTEWLVSQLKRCMKIKYDKYILLELK